MLKIISSIFIFFITLILILISFLITGFEIDSISYNNIKVDKLYVKYDKKLIFKIHNLTFFNDDKTSRTDMKIKFTAQKLFDSFHIKVDEYYLKDPHIKAHGDLFFTLEDIDLKKGVSKVYINNFKLQFDKKLKYVEAQKCFVEFKDDSFYFSFKDPFYEGVSLDKSEVAILDFEKLRLDLRSKDKIKKPLLELLDHYEIKLPISQEYGKNDIFTQLIIPFDIDKEMESYVDIKVKDSKIFIYDTPLMVKNAEVKLNNTLLDMEGKILKEKPGDVNLTYNVDLKGDIDFEKDISQGRFKIVNGSYYGLDTNDTNGDFKINFKEGFVSDLIFDDNSTLNIYGQRFVLDDSSTKYSYKMNKFLSKIDAKHIKYPLKLKLNDQFDLETVTSSGKGEIYFNNEKLIIDNDKINYRLDFNDSVTVDLDTKDINGSFFNFPLISSNLKAFYKDTSIVGEGSFKIDHKNLKLDSKDVDFNISFEDEIDIVTNLNSGRVDLLEEKFDLSETSFRYENDKIDIETYLDNKDHNISAYSKNRIDLNKDTLKGNILLYSEKKNRFDLQLENLTYNASYKDDFYLYSPNLGLEYTKAKDNHFLLINNLKYLNRYFKEIDPDKQSSIYITSNDFNDLNITINNLILDINGSEYKGFFADDKTVEKKEDSNETISVHLNGYDGKVNFNGYLFEYDKIFLESKNKKFEAKLEKGKTRLNVGQDKGRFIIKSDMLENRYVNTVFGKNWFNDGKMDFYITKENNYFSGRVNLHKTVLEDVRLVNNLLLFINSTPAIINPLLGLPTLFRFTQTGFDMGGYSLDEGYLKFVYDTKKDHLNIFDLSTKGKMNDFKGKVYMDLPNNKIKGSVDVIFMKDYASVLNKIPVLGYIVLGDDGNFYTKVDINGTVDKPAFETNTVRGLLQGVGNSIKRTLGQ